MSVVATRVAGSQSFTDWLSPPVDARSLPSGENATSVTHPLWPLRVVSSCREARSHSLMVLSPLQLARVLPSGENATAKTELVWPQSLPTSRFVARSQSRMLLSMLPVARVLL